MLRFILGGDEDKAGRNPAAVRALRLAAETNPRSVRAQLTLAIHVMAAAVRCNSVCPYHCAHVRNTRSPYILPADAQIVAQSKSQNSQERAAAYREALQRLDFAWASDPAGYEAPTLLCKVLSQMTISRLRGGQEVPPSNWEKLATVCGRAKEVMDGMIAGGSDQENLAGPPLHALSEEVAKNLAALSTHADKHAATLLDSIKSGHAMWCGNKRTYQMENPEAPTNLAGASDKGRKSRRKRKQTKQDL